MGDLIFEKFKSTNPKAFEQAFEAFVYAMTGDEVLEAMKFWTKLLVDFSIENQGDDGK